jgi:3-deoxy-D-manno-octulosonic acid (KDO) 8-phosphate synthase
VLFSLFASRHKYVRACVGPGVFIETHEAPERASSDGPNMAPLPEFEGLMRDPTAPDAAAKSAR